MANALEAMSTGGTLEIATAHENNHVVIRITDNGRGIPAAILPHIFDPFFSTKPAGPGLGLPIVHRIVSQHRGQITIDSQEGVGTTVTIKLPATRPG